MKAVILCDGEIPPASFLKQELSLEPKPFFIAADGGAFTAQKLSLQPDLIIGDLDSYKPTGNETAKVEHDPDQETNDLEKALQTAVDAGANQAIVFGATGKRLDHTLKNLSVLLQFHTKFETLCFKDKYSIMEIIPPDFERTFEPGTTLSLFPLSGTVTGIQTSGLKFPLHNEKLENGVRDGSSNLVTEPKVTISYKDGDLLLITNINQP